MATQRLLSLLLHLVLVVLAAVAAVAGVGIGGEVSSVVLGAVAFGCCRFGCHHLRSPACCLNAHTGAYCRVGEAVGSTLYFPVPNLRTMRACMATLRCPFCTVIAPRGAGCFLCPHLCLRCAVLQNGAGGGFYTFSSSVQLEGNTSVHNNMAVPRTTHITLVRSTHSHIRTDTQHDMHTKQPHENTLKHTQTHGYSSSFA